VVAVERILVDPVIAVVVHEAQAARVALVRLIDAIALVERRGTPFERVDHPTLQSRILLFGIDGADVEEGPEQRADDGSAVPLAGGIAGSGEERTVAKRADIGDLHPEVAVGRDLAGAEDVRRRVGLEPAGGAGAACGRRRGATVVGPGGTGPRTRRRH